MKSIKTISRYKSCTSFDMALINSQLRQLKRLKIQLIVQMLQFVLVGGTQTNQVVINSMLESYEGVISADTGHVAVHEGGAIEFSGHKVITIPSKEGKVSASDVETYMETFKSDFKRTIWYSQEWYIFLILQNMALYTLNLN